MTRNQFSVTYIVGPAGKILERKAANLLYYLALPQQLRHTIYSIIRISNDFIEQLKK